MRVARRPHPLQCIVQVQSLIMVLVPMAPEPNAALMA